MHWRSRSPKTVDSANCLPAKPTQFLTLDEVLAVHERVIEEFGGPAGVRDLGLLESALYRPRSGYYEDLTSMAAALFESLLMNHPFLDGNKRVAFFATDVFLRVNGYRMVVDADAAHRHLIQLLDQREADKEHLERWIRQHLAPM
jgi:death-on-curing protein